MTAFRISTTYTLLCMNISTKLCTFTNMLHVHSKYYENTIHQKNHSSPKKYFLNHSLLFYLYSRKYIYFCFQKIQTELTRAYMWKFCIWKIRVWSSDRVEAGCIKGKYHIGRKQIVKHTTSDASCLSRQVALLNDSVSNLLVLTQALQVQTKTKQHLKKKR